MACSRSSECPFALFVTTTAAQMIVCCHRSKARTTIEIVVATSALAIGRQTISSRFVLLEEKSRRNTRLSVVFLFASQPLGLSRSCSDLPRHVLGCRASLPSGFSSLLLRRSPSIPKLTKPNRGQVGDHSSIGDFAPLAFLVIRDKADRQASPSAEPARYAGRLP